MKNPKEFTEFFRDKDRMAVLLGVKPIMLSATECIYEYEVNSEHFNPNGILHGGALYSAMDSSQGAFVHFILEDTYRGAATGTATIRYNAPLREGVIQIRTWLKGRENRKLFVNSEAKDSAGHIVATLEEIWIAILK